MESLRPCRFRHSNSSLDGWVVKVNELDLNPQQDGDFRAFLNELGIPYKPPM